MVELRVVGGTIEIDVRGLHQLWALKQRIRVPLSAVRSVRRMERAEIRGLWKGWRVPGTHLPGWLIAGTFYKAGERHFWDVRNAERAIAITLRGARYDRLFIELEDPESALRSVSEAAQL